MIDSVAINYSLPSPPCAFVIVITKPSLLIEPHSYDAERESSDELIFNSSIVFVPSGLTECILQLMLAR